MKQLLYISALVSEKKVDEEFKRTGKNPGFAIQKFSRLLVRGIHSNGVKVVTLSPNIRDTKGYVRSSVEIEDDIVYKYIPYYNVPFIKHICVCIYTFIYVLRWGSVNKEDKIIICDVLSVSACLGALLASKINRIKSVAIVTDIYGLMVNGQQSFLSRAGKRINAFYVNSFNKYILLTEQMNEIVNLKRRPYIIMEALCDSTIIPVTMVSKSHPRTIIYAGGIHEKYGVRMLTEGFLKADIEDAKLVLYGSGPYVDEFKCLCDKYSNLEYRGVAANDVVVSEELKATLLVNPRLTKEELTKYSFPSKNMEYMASGTPLLTTRLPGMPREYYPFVFLFEEETIDGYADAIRSALSYSEEDLRSFGFRARQFVLQNKNNIYQGNRVVSFIFSN
ncbi:MAG: glycosyltransferase [Bacteroidaceae bacterium]|nr:glycosyltransferase [Bacteroidaceae bacterium]